MRSWYFRLYVRACNFMGFMLVYRYVSNQEKTNSYQEKPDPRQGYRLFRSASGGYFHTNCRTREAFEETQEGQPLTPRAHQDGGRSTYPFEIFGTQKQNSLRCTRKENGPCVGPFSFLLLYYKQVDFF